MYSFASKRITLLCLVMLFSPFLAQSSQNFCCCSVFISSLPPSPLLTPPFPSRQLLMGKEILLEYRA